MSTRRRDPFRRWLLRLICWLVPLCAAWWWLGGAEWFLRGLHLLAAGLLPERVFQDVNEIVMQADQSWKVRTALIIEGSNQQNRAIFFVDRQTLWRIVMGFPLLWALVLATSGRWQQRQAWGTLLLGVVSLLCITVDVGAKLVTMVNHQPSFIDGFLAPPAFKVYADPYPNWLFHLSAYGEYLVVLIVPIMAPVLIWLFLCPRDVMRLLVALRHRIKSNSSRKPDSIA